MISYDGFLGTFVALATSDDSSNPDWPHAAQAEVPLLATAGVAWSITNHQSFIQLWTPNNIRGTNTEVVGPEDFIANPSRVDEQSFSFGMTVVGECDHNGVLFDDTWVGLRSNINYLMTHLVCPGLPRPCHYLMPGYPSADREVDLYMQFDQLITGEPFEGHDPVLGTPGGAMCLAILKTRMQQPINWPG